MNAWISEEERVPNDSQYSDLTTSSVLCLPETSLSRRVPGAQIQMKKYL